MGKGRLWFVLWRREGVGFRGGISVGMILQGGKLGSEVVVWFLERWALIGREYFYMRPPDMRLPVALVFLFPFLL